MLLFLSNQSQFYNVQINVYSLFHRRFFLFHCTCKMSTRWSPETWMCTCLFFLAYAYLTLWTARLYIALLVSTVFASHILTSWSLTCLAMSRCSITLVGWCWRSGFAALLYFGYCLNVNAQLLFGSSFILYGHWFAVLETHSFDLLSLHMNFWEWWQISRWVRRIHHLFIYMTKESNPFIGNVSVC